MLPARSSAYGDDSNRRLRPPAILHPMPPTRSHPTIDDAAPNRRWSWLARAILSVVALVGMLPLIGAVLTAILERSAERRFPCLGSFVSVRSEMRSDFGASASKTLDLDDATTPTIALNYLEAGAGQPVVLLHGAFGGLQDWSATIMGTLAARYRVIAFDRPGHGYSERVPGRANDPSVQAEVLRAALHDLRVERPILVGFSWGGAVALAYALDHQQELEALVTVSVASHVKENPTSPIYRIPSIPLVGWLFEHTLVLPLGRATAQSRIANSFAPEPVPDSFVASPVDLALTPGRFSANAEDLVILDDFARGQSKRYGQLTLPTWILVGEGDRVANPHIHSYRLHEQVRGSHLVSIKGAGHQLLYRHAREILEAIDAAGEEAKGRGR